MRQKLYCDSKNIPIKNKLFKADSDNMPYFTYFTRLNERFSCHFSVKKSNS